MSTPTWLTPEELAAWKHLSLMQLQLDAHLNRDLLNSGLSLQDYLVLATLSDQADGQRRLNEIGAELGWEKSRVSHHISRMCARGLVEKVACPTDQRGWFVSLTQAGRQAATTAAPSHVAHVRALFFDHLTSDEVNVIAEISQRVLSRLPATTARDRVAR